MFALGRWLSHVIASRGSQRRISIERGAMKKKDSNKYLWKKNRFRVKKQRHDESETKRKENRKIQNREYPRSQRIHKKMREKEKEKRKGNDEQVEHTRSRPPASQRMKKKDIKRNMKKGFEGTCSAESAIASDLFSGYKRSYFKIASSTCMQWPVGPSAMIPQPQETPRELL